VDDFPYRARTNFWDDTGTGNFTEDKVYVVQTNTKVVERCILLATDPGDLVLDPTCGSGTTAFVAERWGRRWITVDSSRVALAIARQRLAGALHPYFVLADSEAGRNLEAELSGSALPAAETGGDVRKGFVYERARRITLGSIANNPDIREGMPQGEIDKAIARHADTELLFDRPLRDESRIRVSGPFTVESLSPHRNRSPEQALQDGASDDGLADTDFLGMILENLRESGIQNGLRNERLEFDLVEPHAGAHIQAVGSREMPAPDVPGRVGICIGPQYGTVGPAFVKDAAREAARDRSFDLLCILAFAFDPQVLNSDEEYMAADEGFDVAAVRSLGRVPVLLVRMNSDLLMGEQLAAKAGGNLFTTFGEPDIEITVEDEDVHVELHGVDVYDPNTGTVRSDRTDRIALWMIDTDYDGESFFVRHCYFTGGQDPYKRLKTALKADIDQEAWESLYRTVSRPFPKPSTGSIAVKVINDYGDEVVKVYEVS
jgi:adenine-specific DNA-methyltransferase